MMKLLITLFKIAALIAVLAVGVYFFGHHGLKQMFQEAWDHIQFCISWLKEHM
jgi:sarcosine oxidase delta subunit